MLHTRLQQNLPNLTMLTLATSAGELYELARYHFGDKLLMIEGESQTKSSANLRVRLYERDTLLCEKKCSLRLNIPMNQVAELAMYNSYLTVMVDFCMHLTQTEFALFEYLVCVKDENLQDHLVMQLGDAFFMMYCQKGSKVTATLQYEGGTLIKLQLARHMDKTDALVALTDKLHEQAVYENKARYQWLKTLCMQVLAGFEYSDYPTLESQTK